MVRARSPLAGPRTPVRRTPLEPKWRMVLFVVLWFSAVPHSLLRSCTKPLVPSAGRKLGAAGRVVLYLVLDFALGSVSLVYLLMPRPRVALPG